MKREKKQNRRIGYGNPKAAMYRRRKQNKFAVLSIVFVVAMLISVIVIDAMNLRQKQEANEERKEELSIQIAAEETRHEELLEFEKYTRTKKYAEEVAKEKLGLVHEDEIIFKPDD